MRKFIVFSIVMLMAVSAYAVQFTDNYNMQIPASGERDWLSKISNDIISIDAIMGITSADVGDFYNGQDSTTANIINITGDSLTTGSMASFISNSAETDARNLVEIVNDNAAADSAVGLLIQQDGADASIELTGNGSIQFPATQGASSNANALDDYEEGTWTPGITFGGAAVDLTYSVQAGYYTKVGNIVTLTCYVELSANGTSVGTALITGMPFTVVNNNAGYSTPAIRCAGVSFANQYAARAAINGTTINLYESTEAGVQTVLDNTNFAIGSGIMLTVTYRVA